MVATGCGESDAISFVSVLIFVGVVRLSLLSWLGELLSLTVNESVHMLSGVMSSREWRGQKPISRCLLLAGQALAEMFLVGGVSNVRL